MSLVGPRVETKLSPMQAAIRGGSCGGNIRKAFAHLAAANAPSPPVDQNLWKLVLGPCADACNSVAEDAACGDIDTDPAAFLADQSKAFERLSLSWLFRVLRRWGLPG